MNLEYEVKNQTCKRTDSNYAVDDSQEYLEIEFDFKTNDWTNCNKFIFFRCKGVNYPYGISNDKIIVPAIFLKNKELIFGVYGVNNDVRITTNINRVSLGKSYYDSETAEIDDTVYTETVVEEIFEELNRKSNIGHTHTKSEITDFPTTMPPSTHDHDDRYYTEAEVNELIEQAKQILINRIGLTAEESIVQTDESVNLVCFIMSHGVPLPNQRVDFYEVYEPRTLQLKGDKNIIQVDEDLTLSAVLKDEDDSRIAGETISFYDVTDEA